MRKSDRHWKYTDPNETLEYIKSRTHDWHVTLAEFSVQDRHVMQVVSSLRMISTHILHVSCLNLHFVRVQRAWAICIVQICSGSFKSLTTLTWNDNLSMRHVFYTFALMLSHCVPLYWASKTLSYQIWRAYPLPERETSWKFSSTLGLKSASSMWIALRMSTL